QLEVARVLFGEDDRSLEVDLLDRGVLEADLACGRDDHLQTRLFREHGSAVQAVVEVLRRAISLDGRLPCITVSRVSQADTPTRQDVSTSAVRSPLCARASWLGPEALTLPGIIGEPSVPSGHREEGLPGDLVSK